MSVFRSYFSAQATLLRDNPTNNSRNPIIELSYGGSQSTGTTKISRYVCRVELSGLQSEIANKELTKSNTVSHKLCFKNVIAQAPDMAGNMMNDAKRGAGLTVQVYVLSESFDEGIGYDYLYYQGTNTHNPQVEAPNWTYRKTGVKWAAPGTFNTPVPTEVLGTFRLEQGNEDMEFDVTNYMNQVLFSNRIHYGFGVCLVHDDELLVSTQRRVLTFFSKYTQSFFEPYLETNYGTRIWENRCAFPLDDTNYLYLQTKKQIQGVDHVEIYDHDDRLIINKSASEVQQLSNNLYRIPCTIPSSAYPDAIIFKDIWYCKINGLVKKQEQDFTLFEDQIALETGEAEYSDYWFSLSGIRHNETILRAPTKRRVVVNAKRLFQGAVDTNPDLVGLTYRLYVMSGKYLIEIIPKTPVNRLHDLIFFDIDLSWLVPQQYYLEVQLQAGGREINQPQPTKFKIAAC